MLKDSELEDKTGTPGSVLVSGHPSDSGIVGPWILTLRLSDPGDSEEGSRVAHGLTLPFTNNVSVTFLHSRTAFTIEVSLLKSCHCFMKPV